MKTATNWIQYLFFKCFRCHIGQAVTAFISGSRTLCKCTCQSFVSKLRQLACFHSVVLIDFMSDYQISYNRADDVRCGC